MSALFALGTARRSSFTQGLLLADQLVARHVGFCIEQLEPQPGLAQGFKSLASHHDAQPLHIEWLLQFLVSVVIAMAAPSLLF